MQIVARAQAASIFGCCSQCVIQIKLQFFLIWYIHIFVVLTLTCVHTVSAVIALYCLYLNWLEFAGSFTFTITAFTVTYATVPPYSKRCAALRCRTATDSRAPSVKLLLENLWEMPYKSGMLLSIEPPRWTAAEYFGKPTTNNKAKIVWDVIVQRQKKKQNLYVIF